MQRLYQCLKVRILHILDLINKEYHALFILGSSISDQEKQFRNIILEIPGISDAFDRIIADFQGLLVHRISN